MKANHGENELLQKTLVSMSRQAGPKRLTLGKKTVLLVDPRPVRHRERIQDLFYTLFKRNKK